MIIQYTPGKNLSVADTLSRAYLPRLPEDELNLESQVHMIISNLPISETILTKFQHETAKDQVVQKLRWPDHKEQLAVELTPFREEISEANGITMKGERLIVPSTMRMNMKEKIHDGHLGIEKFKSRARETLFWPGMNMEITD